MAKIQKIKGGEEQHTLLRHSPQELLAFCEASAVAIEAKNDPDNDGLVVFFQDLAAICKIIIGAIDHEDVIPIAPKPNGPKS